MAITQVSNNLVKQDLTISGGTVDNTVIGSGTPAAGTFTTIGGTLASSVVGTTQSAGDNSTKIATTGYVETAIANLADSAPSTLDTLNELAAALGDDANFSTTVTNSIATKLPLAGGTLTGDLLVSVAAGNPSLTLKTAGAGNNPHINYRAGNSIVFDTMLVASAATDYWRVGYGASGSVTSEFLAVTTAGNVGIGTTSPDGTLHVKDTVAQVYIQSNDGQASQIVFGDVSDASRGRINYDSSDNMIFETNNLQERMRIDSSGNVTVKASGADQARTLSLQGTNGASETYQFNLIADGENAAAKFMVGVGGGSATERMRIDSTGNVLIGGQPSQHPSSGRTTLEVAGTNQVLIGTTINGSASAYLYDSGPSGSFEINHTNSVYINADDSFRIATGVNQERMRIDSSGKLLLNTTTHTLTDTEMVVSSEYNAAGTTTGGITLSARQGGGWRNSGIFANGTDLTFTTGDTGLNGAQSSSEKMRIDSSGNVGINTTDVSAIFKVRATAPGYTNNGTVFWGGTTNSESHTGISLNSAGDALFGSVGSNIYYSNSATATQSHTNRSSGEIQFGNTTTSSVTSEIKFGGYVKGSTTFTERMRIDTSGNLLVGGTNSRPAEFSHPKGISFRGDIGQIQASTDGNIPIVINRDSSDGDLIYMLREGAVVGSIGSVASNYLSIGTGDTGLLFQDDNDFIEPCNVGTSAGRDAAIDLGQLGGRFKDLYLSGGVYLGGTGSANHLDEYEEGAWTPALWQGTHTYTGQTGRYVRIGRMVTVFGQMSISSRGSSTSELGISGLPFTSSGSQSAYASVLGIHSAYGSAPLLPTGVDPTGASVEGSNAYFRTTHSTNVSYSINQLNSSGEVTFAFTYET